MSDERSINLIYRHTDAIEKFDYFLTGLAVALVGWIAGQPTALQVDSISSALELSALTALLGSAYAGLKRVEAHIEVLRMNALALRGEETASTRARALSSQAVVFDSDSRKPIDRSELQESVDEQRRLTKKAKRLLGEASEKGGKWYRARSRLLIAGFIFLVLSRGFLTVAVP